MNGITAFGGGFVAGVLTGAILAAMVWSSLSLWICTVW